MNKEVQFAFANAIIEKLWVKGFITEEESEKIIEKVREKIFANAGQKFYPTFNSINRIECM